MSRDGQKQSAGWEEAEEKLGLVNSSSGIEDDEENNVLEGWEDEVDEKFDPFQQLKANSEGLRGDFNFATYPFFFFFFP